MRTVTCKDCGKRYDYDRDDFCPKCGSYNPPVEKPATRLEEEMLTRFRTGREGQRRPAKAPPRPQAQAKTPQPGPRRVNYRPTQGGAPEVRAGQHAGRIQGCAACEEPVRRGPHPGVVLAAVILAVGVLTAAGVLFAFNGAPGALSQLSFGGAPETAVPSYPPPRSGVHEVGEPFSINATQLTVDGLWEVDVSAAPSVLPEGMRCVAVDLWVEGGVRRDDLAFPSPYLKLEDAMVVHAVDGDALLSRKLKSCGVFDVTLSDAQWEDPLFGQLVFFVPEDCGRTATLVLPEAEPGVSASSVPTAFHTLSVELP